MRIGNNLQKYLLIGIVMLGFAIVGVVSVLLMNVALADSDEEVTPANGERLISLHDRGVERNILTKAHTVREALEAAEVEIAEGQDVVEPGLDEELVATKYNINIYRARPVTIVDGSKRQRVTTAHQTPKQIAEVAGIKLYPEDTVETRSGDDLLVNGADTVIEIDRANPVMLTLYGKQTEVRTHAETVGDMLEEKDITLGEDDTLSVSEDTPIAKGMSIEIWRDGKQTVTVEEEIDFEVEKVQDANREVGYREVKEAGVKGKKNVTYEIEMKNGQEVSRKEIASVTTTEPKKQVETVGTKLNLPAGGHEAWMAAAGISSSDYGYVNAIFSQESGWNPGATNPSGYYGLGQTSLSRLTSACGATWASDPVCQIGVFNGYAVSRYGSWQGAYDFKFTQGNGWW